MSTELETAHGSPWVFTKTSNDESGIIDTADFFDIIDTMDIKLGRKNYLLTISYYLEIEIPSPAENEDQFEAVLILCTLDPTSADLLTGGVDCNPNGGGGTGSIRGVPFGNNLGIYTQRFNTQRYHGAHSFNWIEKVKGGSHMIVMRAKFDLFIGTPQPGGLKGVKIRKRTLVVQAFPI